MIKAPKVIVTTQEKLVVGTRTLGAPLHEHEVGRTMSSGHRFCADRSGAEKGPREMRVWGRIVGVRSTEQSVFNQNVTFGVRIISI